MVFIFVLSVFWHKLYLYSEKQVEENKILIFNPEIFTVNLMVYNLLVFFFPPTLIFFNAVKCVVC